MESPLSFFRMHWDQETGLARSSRRESAQASPMKNERTHVRCYTVHGESREAFSARIRSVNPGGQKLVILDRTRASLYHRRTNSGKIPPARPWKTWCAWFVSGVGSGLISTTVAP